MKRSKRIVNCRRKGGARRRAEEDEKQGGWSDLRIPDIFRHFSCLERSQEEEVEEEEGGGVSVGFDQRRCVRGLRGNCTHKSKLSFLWGTVTE